MRKKTTVCSTCKAHFLTDVDYANHLPSNSKKCGGHNSAFVVGGLGSAGRHFGRSIYSTLYPSRTNNRGLIQGLGPGLRFRPYPYVIVFDVWKAVERMSSRSDLSNLQETPSSRSAFRDDREDEGVVEQMF
ncbi:unnamed protein product [Prunus armeniaca]